MWIKRTCTVLDKRSDPKGLCDIFRSHVMALVNHKCRGSSTTRSLIRNRVESSLGRLTQECLIFYILHRWTLPIFVTVALRVYNGLTGDGGSRVQTGSLSDMKLCNRNDDMIMPSHLHSLPSTTDCRIPRTNDIMSGVQLKVGDSMNTL